MTKVNARLRMRLLIAAHVAAGTLGAYGFASLFTVALSQLLVGFGMVAFEAVTTATLASFAVFAVAAMVTFHAGGALRAWGWLLAASAPLASGIFWLPPGASG